MVRTRNKISNSTDEKGYKNIMIKRRLTKLADSVLYLALIIWESRMKLALSGVGIFALFDLTFLIAVVLLVHFIAKRGMVPDHSKTICSRIRDWDVKDGTLLLLRDWILLLLASHLISIHEAPVMLRGELVLLVEASFRFRKFTSHALWPSDKGHRRITRTVRLDLWVRWHGLLQPLTLVGVSVLFIAVARITIGALW